MKGLVLGITVLAVTVSANAALITYAEYATTVTTTEGNSGTYNVWHLKVSTDYDWTNTAMDLTLTSGQMYQHPMGGGTQPSPYILPSHEDLEWDTYAAVPTGYPEIASFTGSPVIDTTDFDACWCDTDDDGAGDWIIAQISLSLDATGDITGKSYSTEEGIPGVGVSFDHLYIVDGQILPEPAVVSMLLIGGLALSKRRRK